MAKQPRGEVKGKYDAADRSTWSDKRILFCKNRAAGKSQLESYRLSGYALTYAADTKNPENAGKPLPENWMKIRACEIDACPEIKAYIKDLRSEMADSALEDTASTILLMAQRYSADATEISGVKYLCCRYCWGDGNRYQRTAGEMERDREFFEAKLNTLLDSADEKDREKAQNMGSFDIKGGIGFDPRKLPNPDCTECFGQGVMVPYVADTTTLSPEAKAIYRGIKTRKDGSIEILTSRESADTLLPKIQGLLKERLEMSGNLDVTNLTKEERDAELRAIALAIARATEQGDS